MISFLRGEIADIDEDKVILDVNGVGYGIFMSGQALAELPAIGSEIKLFTYLNVKEDAMQLFGFKSKDELRIFKMLIGVSGIGPKGGLAILSVLSPDDLCFAVNAGDAKAIAKAPGIGKRTAEKLIIELKDKLRLEDVLERSFKEEDDGPIASTQITSVQSDAISALVALGYGQTDALKAVRKTELSDSASVEDILRQALKFMI